GARTPARFDHPRIFLAEFELIDHLFRQEFGVADIVHLHPAHHLPGDHLQVLVVDVDALQTVDLLDFVDQVLLQVFLAHHRHDVVRIARAVHHRIAVANALAFLDVDVNAARKRVLALFAVVSHDVYFAHSLGNFAVFHGAVDLGDHGGFTRLAGFEQLHDARKAARDVLGFGGSARNLRHHLAGVYFVAVRHGQVGVHRHQVPLLFGLGSALRANQNG